jgi:mRNA-degrading endonuclease RelE of RelBE toxin-antitoxin system
MAWWFTKRAAKGLQGMPRNARASLLTRLKAIAVDPFERHANVTALRGDKDAFRLRQGDWRAMYRVGRVRCA